MESAGIGTVCINTRQDLAECTKAPRSYIVKFPYGAATGAPGDKLTQIKVLKEALMMLENSPHTPAIQISEHRWKE